MLRLDLDLHKYYQDTFKVWWRQPMLFDHKQFKEIIEDLNKKDKFINEANKEKYSKEFIDFLFKLLTYEQEDRPTATECLNHEWFTGNPLTAAIKFSEEQSTIIEGETKAYNEALDAADAYATEQKERKKHGSTARVLEFPPVHVEPVRGGSKKTNRKRSKGKKRSNRKKRSSKK